MSWLGIAGDAALGWWPRVKWPLVLAGFVFGCLTSYKHGIELAQTHCNSAQVRTVARAQQQVLVATTKAVARAQTVGLQREGERARIDTLFQAIAQEAQHDAPNPPVDACELPAERLRRWATANAGADEASAPAAEPADATTSLAATGFWAHARSGGQPSAGGSGLSPLSEPALPLVALPELDAP